VVGFRQTATISATLNGAAQGVLTLLLPPSPLIGWWRLDEGAGTLADDASNSAYNGTLVNAPSWIPGRIGQALSFSGANYVNLGNPPGLRALGSLTVSAWVRPSTLNNGHSIVSWDAGSTNFYSLTLKDGGTTSTQGPGFQIQTSNGSETVFFNKFDWNPSQWYHLAGSFDAATGVMKIYVNGALAASRTLAAGTVMQAGTFGTQTASIGADGGVGFTGSIDDVRIYNASLADAEITALFAAAGSAPSAVSSVTLSPNPVTGGAGVTGTVTLNNPAPAGTAVVALTSSNPAAVVPPTVTVPAGALSATFAVTTSTVTSQQPVNITATYNGTAQTVLNVNPAGGAPASLIGWWRLDEGATTTTADASGNGSTGQLSGGPVWTAGRLGQALQFTGTNWVDLGNSAVLRAVTSITVSAWIKPSGANDSRPLVVWDSGSINFYALTIKDSGSTSLRGPSFSIRTPAGSESVFFNKSDWDTTQWYLLTGSFDTLTKSLKLYVNGVLVSSRTLSATAVMERAAFGTQKAYIGSDAGVGLVGTLDDIRIYSGALADADVLALFGAVPAPPSIVNVTLSANSVTGGASVTGTVNLSAPASGSALVTLASSNTAAAVPANVSVNEGAISATFPITTTTVTSPQVATITATFNGTAQVNLTVSPPSGGGPAPTLAGWWKLDEGTGNTTADSSGNGSTGQLVNGPIWSPGRTGQALGFTGTNHVDLGNPAILRNLSALTVAAWVKPGGVNNGQSMIAWDSGSVNFYALNLKDSGSTALQGLTFQIQTNNGSESLFFNKFDWNTSQWYFVTGSFDSASRVMKIYIDGVPAASRTLPAGAIMQRGIYGTQKVYIGADAGVGFIGSIDDARIYTGALSDSDVSSLFAGAGVAVAVTSVTLSSGSVTGGASVTGTVNLSAPAPAGGASVGLASTNPAASVPPNVSVPAGATSANFNIATSIVTVAQSGNITATYNGTAQAGLTVNPSGGTAPSGPVGHWKLDEGSGSTTADSSPNAITGTLTGAPGWIPGRSGQALEFTGTNRVDLGNPAVLRNLSSVTVSAWVRPGMSNNGRAVIAWDSGSVNFYALTVKDSGSLSLQGTTFSIRTATGQESVFFNKYDWNPAQWYLLTASFDHATKALKIYVDGVLVVSRVLPATAAMQNTTFGTQKVYIGADYTDGIAGAVDEARIYNRALTDSEVAALVLNP
jgi:hypothetical protein